MVLRLLFVLLIALNIAVGAWLWLGQDETHVRSATDPGVPTLHLLSERPTPSASAAVAASAPARPASSAPAPAPTVTAAASAPVAATPVAAPVPAPPSPSSSAPRNPNSHVYTCIAIGPFATPVDMHNARVALGTQAVRMRSRQEQTSQSHGWWVYLAAAPSREQALATARRLSAANVKDYFVVGNTVSLGLFKDPSNARKRRDEITTAGFPAQMTERTETVPEYWLDLAVADNNHFDWRSRVRTPGVGSHSTGCF